MASSVMLIEELGGLKRKLELVGSGLPFRGANWGRAMRMVTTWFPGNAAEASQQVLGPIELPSEWEGEWKTTLLVSDPCKLDGADITRASTLRDVVDDIVGGGMRLRVTWTVDVGGISRRVVREGRIAELDCAHDRPDDVRWHMRLEWSGRGQQTQRVVALRSDGVQSKLKSQVQALDDLAAVVDTTDYQPDARTPGLGEVSSFSLGDLEAIANMPAQLASQVAQIGKQVANRARHLGELMQTVRSTPADIMGQMADVATDAISVASQFVDEIGRPAPETLSTETKVRNVLQAASYFGKVSGAAGRVIDESLQVRAAAKAHRARNAAQLPEDRTATAGTGDVQSVVIARDGDTMPGLSNRYYGTPTLAAAIAKANGLPAYSIRVEPGTMLVIPEVRNAQRLIA